MYYKKIKANSNIMPKVPINNNNNNCRDKGPRSYIGLWDSPGTIDKSEERQIVVKGPPVKVS